MGISCSQSQSRWCSSVQGIKQCKSWNQKWITAWNEQLGLLALVNYGFCFIIVQKKATNELWERNHTCHWCLYHCITDSGSFRISIPSRSTLSKGQKSFLLKMSWCLLVSWGAETSVSLLLLSRRGRPQFFCLYRHVFLARPFGYPQYPVTEQIGCCESYSRCPDCPVSAMRTFGCPP